MWGVFGSRQLSDAPSTYVYSYRSRFFHGLFYGSFSRFTVHFKVRLYGLGFMHGVGGMDMALLFFLGYSFWGCAGVAAGGATINVSFWEGGYVEAGGWVAENCWYCSLRVAEGVGGWRTGEGCEEGWDGGCKNVRCCALRVAEAFGGKVFFLVRLWYGDLFGSYSGLRSLTNDAAHQQHCDCDKSREDGGLMAANST
jgi:hypothetical protein